MNGWLASGPVPGPFPSGTPSFQPGVFVATPGINIGQLLGILLPLVICAIAVLTYRDIRLSKRQEATAQLVRKAVEDLVAVLTERLETKENVALVRIDVARVRTEVATLREVIRELNRTVEQQQRQQRQKRPGP